MGGEDKKPETRPAAEKPPITCECPCHDPGTTIFHVMPCCNRVYEKKPVQTDKKFDAVT